MAVEVVVLVPILLLVLLLVVAFGRYVAHEGETEAAAREAVRAATLERDESSAVLAAQAAAEATLADHLDCRPVVLRGAFVAGGTLTAEVTCTVSWHDLGVIGLGGTVDVAGASSAPIDLYRRTGGP